MNNEKIVALIPVRGGSKSIPLKNIKDFCSKPLVYWSVEAAVKSKYISKVYISTDSEIIKECVLNFGFDKVEVIARGCDTSTDTASTESVMVEFLQKINDFSHLMLIQATSPLLTSDDIDNAIEKYRIGKYDSILSVVNQKRFIWNKSDNLVTPLNYDIFKRPRRQDWDGYFVENGAFYLTTKDLFATTKSRISGSIGYYEMSEDTYFEIDEPSDWIIAEKLKERTLKSATKSYKNVSLLVCDVDGVLTDGGMYYSTSGEEMKKFNTRDGMGLELIRKQGISVMFLTSEKNLIIENRVKKLNIDYLFMGIKNKKIILDNFFKENPQFSYDNTVYVGDDVNDLETMINCKYSFCPSDASDQIKNIAMMICKKSGGDGCVREVCDFLLKNGFLK